MPDDMTVEVLEPDDAGTSTRGQALQRAIVLGGAVVTGGVLVTGLPRLALSAPSKEQDVEVLNFALTLESLQAAFYAEALREGRLTGEWRQFAETVGSHERSHLSFITRSLGKKARSAPRARFGQAVKSAPAVAKAAVALEDMGVAAYNGQATNLTGAALKAVAPIVSVEARHAAWSRDLAGMDPAPAATDVSASESDVLRDFRRRGLLG